MCECEQLLFIPPKKDDDDDDDDDAIFHLVYGCSISVDVQSFIYSMFGHI